MKNILIKNKKIAIVVKYFYPVAAGIETNIMETYSILAEKGWDITIHTSLDTLTEKNCLPKAETIRGLEVKRYPFTKLAYFPDINWKQIDMVCLHNFNIIPHLYILLYSLLLKILGQKNFRLVLTPHGGFNPEWKVFPKIGGFIKKMYHFTVGTLLINLAIDGVRAVSEWEKNEIISKGVTPGKVTVIDNGIEDEAYLDVEKKASQDIKNKVKLYGKYIIQIGRVYPIKNYETTIKALSKTPTDLNYVIAGPLDYVMGKATYKETLNKLIKKLGLGKRVFFTGVVRDVDKYYLIKKAQMMVHMAIWESFCNVVHEGLSQGLVCIVANNTALPFLIKDGVNGYCVKTYDYEGVANKINYVLENKTSKEIKDMENQNRIYGLKNSWRSVADTMDQWFKNNLTQLSTI